MILEESGRYTNYIQLRKKQREYLDTKGLELTKNISKWKKCTFELLAIQYKCFPVFTLKQFRKYVRKTFHTNQ